MDKKELEKKIKDYVKNHKNLTKELVRIVDLEQAEKDLGIDMLYVMEYLKYGCLL